MSISKKQVNKIATAFKQTKPESRGYGVEYEQWERDVFRVMDMLSEEIVLFDENEFLEHCGIPLE